MASPEPAAPATLASIAVIIPVYRVTDYLEEAIASATSQDYARKEVIVVDDGSPEESAAEIGRICSLFPNVTLLRRPHIGAAAARHAGATHTSCDAIVFLDGDDILLPGALTYFAEALQKNPTAIATYARTIRANAEGVVSTDSMKNLKPLVSGKAVLHRILKNQSPFCNGSICIRRDVLLTLKPNNENIVLGEDWILWCHLALRGDIVPAGENIVLKYRKHSQNTSWLLLENHELLLEAYETIFTDPRFVQTIGQAELDEFRNACHDSVHRYLASRYAVEMKPEKAMYHLNALSSPLKGRTE